MPAIESKIDVNSEAFARNRAHMLGLIDRLRALEARAREKSALVRNGVELDDVDTAERRLGKPHASGFVAGPPASGQCVCAIAQLCVSV